MSAFLWAVLGFVLGGFAVIGAQLYFVALWFQFYQPSRDNVVSEEVLVRRKEAFVKLTTQQHQKIIELEGSAKAESCVWFNAILANLFTDFRAAPFRVAIEDSLVSSFEELRMTLVGKSLKTIALKEYGIGNGVPVITGIKFLSGDTVVSKPRTESTNSNGGIPSIVVGDDADGLDGSQRRGGMSLPSANEQLLNQKQMPWYHGDVVVDLVYQGSIHFKIEIETILGLVGVLSVSIAQVTGKMLVRLSSDDVSQYNVGFLDEPRMTMEICALLGGKEVASLSKVIDSAVRNLIATRFTLPNIVSYNVRHNPDDGGMTVTTDRLRLSDRASIPLADQVFLPSQLGIAFRDAHCWIVHDFPKGSRCIRCSLLINKIGYYCRDCSYVCHKRCMGRLVSSEVRCPVGLDCGDKGQGNRSAVTAGYTEGGRLHIKVMGASGVASKDVGGTSDPYCIVSVGGQQARTRHIIKTLEPKWNESFEFDIGQRGPWALRLTVFDWDKLGRDDYIGAAVLNVKSLVPGVHFRETVSLHARTGGEDGDSGRITVELMFEEREGNVGGGGGSGGAQVPSSKSMPMLSNYVRQPSSHSLTSNMALLDVAENEDTDGFNMVVVKSSSDYAGQTELSMKVRRHEAIDGFLETEEKYVADLERVVRDYCVPIRQHRPADAAAILGNFEDVTRATRAMLTFLRESKAKQVSWGSVRIGEAFTTGKLGFFDALAEYCSARGRCAAEYAARTQADRGLREELRSLGLAVPDVPDDATSTSSNRGTTPSASSSSGGASAPLKPGLWALLSSQNGSRANLSSSINGAFSLLDHTVMPERRIMDYSSLLRRVIMMTVPENPDYIHLADALSRVGEMESVLKSRKSTLMNAGDSERLAELRKGLQLSPDEAEAIDLHDDSRSVVYEGQLRVESGKQVDVVLLDNVILLIVDDVPGGRLYKMPFLLDETAVNGNIIGVDGKEIASAFALTCDDVHLILRAESGAVKHKWVGLIVATSKAYSAQTGMEGPGNDRGQVSMGGGDDEGGEDEARRSSKLLKSLSLDPNSHVALQSRRRAVTNPHSVVQTAHDVMSGSSKKTKEQRKLQGVRDDHQGLMSELRVVMSVSRDRKQKLKELVGVSDGADGKNHSPVTSSEISRLKTELEDLSKRQKQISDALDKNMRAMSPAHLGSRPSSSQSNMPHAQHAHGGAHVFGPVAPIADNANDQRKFRKTFGFGGKEAFDHVYLCVLAKSGFGLGTLFIADRLICYKSKGLFKKTLKIKVLIDDLQYVEEVGSSVRLTEITGAVHVFESFSGSLCSQDLYRVVVELWASGAK
eukprot:Opistho-2@15396